MASLDQNTYLEEPLNPYIEDYDLGLRSHSEIETHRLYSEEKNGIIKRSDWRSQRKRRNTRAPTDEDAWQAYGIRLHTRQAPRTISCCGSDYRDLVDEKAITEYVNVVIAHKPTTGEAGAGTLPCVFYIHGGCRYGGTPYSGYLERAKEWAARFDAIAVSVDYRLSPNETDESPTGEEPMNDCFDALIWTYHQLGAEEDEILQKGDRKKIILFGTSAGGGLAASVAMKWYQAKHQGLIGALGDLHGLVLEAPQLDDRCSTRSHKKFRRGNMFTSTDALLGWKTSLGARRGTEHVSIFEAPARASDADVRGFPPTYIEVGAVEPFKDEVEDFGKTLRKAEVDVEMNTWYGGFHGFFAANPKALVSRLCNLTKLRWLCRRLGAQCNDLDKEYKEVKEAYDARPGKGECG